MSEPFFKDIGTIACEGPDTDNPFAFRYYDAEQEVMGKTMADHLRPAVCYWHTFSSPGAARQNSITRRSRKG